MSYYWQIFLVQSCLLVKFIQKRHKCLIKFWMTYKGISSDLICWPTDSFFFPLCVLNLFWTIFILLLVLAVMLGNNFLKLFFLICNLSSELHSRRTLVQFNAQSSLVILNSKGPKKKTLGCSRIQDIKVKTNNVVWVSSLLPYNHGIQDNEDINDRSRYKIPQCWSDNCDLC